MTQMRREKDHTLLLLLAFAAFAVGFQCAPKRPNPEKPAPIVRHWAPANDCAPALVDDVAVCDQLEHDDARGTCLTAAIAGFNACGPAEDARPE